MSTSDTQDAAAKQRIIQHMNADHQDSIRRYVEAYSSKSIFRSRDAQMIDISLDGMTISCSGKDYIIPFDPPLKSFRESRERLVQMDKNALQILGRSEVPITCYVPPYTRLFHFCNFIICCIAFVWVSRPANSKPGSLLYDNLLFLVPPFASFVASISTLVFVGMLFIHGTEACLMARKLKRHGMTPLELTWWKWVGSAFIEGFTSFWRLNDLLEKNRKEGEARRH